MQLTFLQADKPLTKKYTKRADGGYDSESYPMAFRVTSHVENVHSIEEFTSALKKHAELGHCLHTGSLDRQLVDESRKGHHDKDEHRSWIVFDLDGLTAFNGVDELIAELPSQFHDTSYIVQESPSSGIKPGLRAHVFFLLDAPVSPKTVKDWVMEANLVTEKLRDQITLTASNYALSYPLDRVANDNGRPVYIAAPECIGFEDPISDRIRIVQKARERLPFNFRTNLGDVKDEERKRIDSLREAKGLPKGRKDVKYYERTKNGLEVLKENLTSPARIHAVRKDSDLIVRCNLDDGDSEAYFYYIQYPELLRNHKGEPNLYMRALDPEFYAKAKEDAKAAMEKYVQPFVFRNRLDDKWYVGRRKGGEIIEQPHVIGSEAKIEDYFSQYSMAVPDPIPTWEMKFDPTYEEQWNADDRVFNLWRKTEIMSNATYRSLPPPVITQVITHALGGGDEEYERFINWLAYIYQTRQKAGTAWVLHGTQGTGKGLLIDHILIPIFGVDYVGKSQPRNLKEQYNDFMETAIIVNLDEFNIADAGHERGAVQEALKMWITDDYIVLRKMYSPQRKVRNFSNFILTTNSHNAISIPQGERRTNFGLRQEEKLDVPDDIIQLLTDELEHFAGYLSGYEVNELYVRKPLENVARDAAMSLSVNSIEEFVDAVATGNIKYFMNLTREQHDNPALSGEFKIILNGWMTDAKAGKPSAMKTEDLLKAYLLATGERSKPLNKFKKTMAHKGLPSSRPYDPKGNRFVGWLVEWNLDDEDKVELKEHIKPVKSTEDRLKDSLQAPPSPPNMRT